MDPLKFDSQLKPTSVDNITLRAEKKPDSEQDRDVNFDLNYEVREGLKDCTNDVASYLLERDDTKREDRLDAILAKVIGGNEKLGLVSDKVRMTILFLISFLFSQYTAAVASAETLNGPQPSNTKYSDVLRKEENHDQIVNIINDFFEKEDTEYDPEKKILERLDRDARYKSVYMSEATTLMSTTESSAQRISEKYEANIPMRDFYYGLKWRNPYFEEQNNPDRKGDYYIYNQLKEDYRFSDSLDFMLRIAGLDPQKYRVGFGYVIPKDVYEKAGLDKASYALSFMDMDFGSNHISFNYRSKYSKEDLNGLREAEVTFKVFDSLNQAFQSENKIDGSENFFRSVSAQKDNLTESQKIMFMQNLGYIFGENYDKELVATGKSAVANGDVPIEDIIDAAAKYFGEGKHIPAGVCRHINPALARIGAELGLDTFSTEIESGSGGHVVAAVRTSKGNIEYVNYSTLIPTEISDINKAYSILEESYGAVSPGNLLVSSDSGKIIGKMQSEAGKTMFEAADVGRVRESVDQLLNNNERIIDNGKLSLAENPNLDKYKINKNSYVLSFTRFDGSDQDYNSLANMISIGIDKGEKTGLNSGIMIFKKNIKGLGSGGRGLITDQDIMAHLGYKFKDEKKLPANFNLGFAAALEGVMVYNNNSIEKNFGDSISASEGNAAAGIRIAFADPSKPYSFYIQESLRGGIYNKTIQEGYNPKFQIEETSFKVGAEYNTHRVDVGFVGEYKDLSYGSKEDLSLDLYKGDVEIRLNTARTQSDYKTIFPSSTESGIQITKDQIDLGGLEGALVISGSVENKDFGHVSKKEENAQIKMVILF